MITLLVLAASDGSIGGYAVITLAFIVLIALVASRVVNQRYDIKLIVLGLLTAVAAIGYGIVSGETVSISAAGGAASATGQIVAGTGSAAMLMRLAVILVLSGIAASLLSHFNASANQPE